MMSALFTWSIVFSLIPLCIFLYRMDQKYTHVAPEACLTAGLIGLALLVPIVNFIVASYYAVFLLERTKYKKYYKDQKE